MYFVTEPNATAARIFNPNAPQIHKINYCSRYDQNLRTL